ncbi:hemicentin-1-like [Mytilus trossulus]|uniref:hemicentin-1-like n=1 Tax=Mytilus trossulus TaxID=6551 RepID=UPI0030041D8B
MAEAELDVPTVAIIDGFVVNYGSTFTINCSISGTPPPNIIYWEKDWNGILSKLKGGLAGTKGITLDEPSLTINFASMTDSGRYTCIATNAYGTGKSKAANITVHGGLPVKHTPSANYSVVYGDSVTMVCNVTAFPKLEYVNWQGNNNGIYTTLNKGAVGTDGIAIHNPSLTIKSVSFADEGIYHCFASNIAGTERSDAMNLSVNGGTPLVTIPVSRYFSNYGTEVTMECEVTATPPGYIIFWEKNVNGIKTVINAESPGTRGSTINNPSLTILNVTITDSGSYSCLAKNKVGTGHSQYISLTVHGGVPVARIGAPAYSVIFGSKISIHCEVTAEPEHSLVYWEKKNNNVIATINSLAVGTTDMTLNVPSLTIQFPTFSDQGTYTCFSANAIGIGHSSPTILAVTGGRPIATIEKMKYIANYGDTITLQCKVTSIPSYSTLYWQKISEGSITNITTGYQGISGVTLKNPSLTIEFVTTFDAGIYKCIAENAIGTGNSTECSLTIIADRPVIVIEKALHIAFVGFSLEIECSIQSKPKHTYVYWTQNRNLTNTIIIPGTVGFDGMTVNNPNLFIPKVDIFMGGEYICLATNEVGTGQSKATTLIVKYANDELDVSTTNYETNKHEGTTAPEISQSPLPEEISRHETSSSDNQFSDDVTKMKNDITPEGMYVTETVGVDRTDNISDTFMKKAGNDSGNNSGKVFQCSI